MVCHLEVMQILLQNRVRELWALVWVFVSCDCLGFVLSPSALHLASRHILGEREQGFQADGLFFFFLIDFLKFIFTETLSEIQLYKYAHNWENASPSMSFRKNYSGKLLN